MHRGDIDTAAQHALVMRKRAFFGSSKLMLPGAIIGARFRPGFSADLSSWRLAVDDEGNLFQETEVWQWVPEKDIIREHRQEHVEVGPDAVLELLLKAQEVGFASFEGSYEASMSDQASRTLSIRFGEIDRTVHAYGAGWLAQEGNLDMIGFLELWEAIHHHAPFRPR